MGCDMRTMSKPFSVIFDDKACRWLNEHPSQDALVIAYEDSRCSGGGHIREAWLRRSPQRDERSSLVRLRPRCTMLSISQPPPETPGTSQGDGVYPTLP